MYISRIHLENIRSFHKLEIDLLNGGQIPNLLTLIIGKNGTCKSTLLRAIAIGLCYEADAYALLSEPIGGLVTEGMWEAKIEIDLVSVGDTQKPITVTTNIQKQRDEREIIVQDDPAGRDGILGSLPERLFLCGYGAGRGAVGTDVGRPYRVVDSAYGLFDYDQTLIEPELILRRLRDYLSDEYDKTMLKIKKDLLDLSDKDQITLRKEGGVELSGPSIGRHIPLQGWADGYRVTFNCLLDIYRWAMLADKVNQSGDVRGIVLIDELEQHMHPSLQIEMPQRLKKAFPEIQFFATTHSPHTILGASPREVISLHRDGEIVNAKVPPNFHGYSAEDILVDEKLFDTGAYSPEINRDLARYRELANIPKDSRKPEETEELQKLAKELREQQLPEIRQPASDPELKQLLEQVLQRHDL